MSSKLKGQVALVTGGSRGLGAAIAEALADQGADVAISYAASAAKAKAVVERLKAKGVRALAIQADQGDLASAGPLVDQVVAHFGRLDILVNNAAIAQEGRTVEDPDPGLEQLSRIWQVNVVGVAAITRAAARRMSDNGRVIFIGSGFGSKVPLPGFADYAATKAAIAGYAKGVQRDLGHRNITVNVVQPGIMLTDMSAPVVENPPPGLMEAHAIRRIATLEEVAAATVFLAGPDAGYIAGSIVDVSGGFLA